MKTNNKILLAGPWIGELGWELFCWQGHIRRISKDYDKTIIIGRPGHKILYADFADEYIEFDPKSNLTNGWRCEGSVSYKTLVKSIKKTKYIDGKFEIGLGRIEDKEIVDRKGLFHAQLFHKYEKEGEGYDIIFHGRNKESGDVRNWSEENWNNLVKELSGYKIASIGNADSFNVEGTDNLKGINLEELVGVMSNSKLIVGPSSGPMHLASLCGLKHLVWSTSYNKMRYKKHWNPFDTEVIFYEDGEWNPEYKEIAKIIKENV